MTNNELAKKLLQEIYNTGKMFSTEQQIELEQKFISLLAERVDGQVELTVSPQVSPPAVSVCVWTDVEFESYKTTSCGKEIFGFIAESDGVTDFIFCPNCRKKILRAADK